MSIWTYLFGEEELDRIDLRRELIDAEGWENKIYYDSMGVPTVGVGRNLRDKGLSDSEVELLLQNDLDDVLRGCESLPYWKRLNPNRKLVVASMVHNLGMAKFQKFVKTNEALADHDWEKAADEMLDSNWAEQVASRARRLAKMMREG